MTNEEKDKIQKIATSATENFLALKKDFEKAEELFQKLNRTIEKIKPVEKPQKNRRRQ